MATRAHGSPNTADADTRGGIVTGTPKLLLRLEGAAVLAAASAAYAQTGQGWGLFALLFLVPDLSMLGYLAGPRFGAATYNSGHSYLSPLALGAAGLLMVMPMLLPLALIWAAHIGFDRALGYGLKYGTAFTHTHLGLPPAWQAKS
jgi:hypothetical protein